MDDQGRARRLLLITDASPPPETRAAIRKAIANGVNQKLLAYAGKSGSGQYDPLIFEPETGIDEGDIEISDDIVLLKADDARTLIQPPRLTQIEIKPAQATLKPSDSVSFSASGTDQHGRPFPVADVTWTASGGTIDQEGRFSADKLGSYRIEARADSVAATAEARVQEAAPPPAAASTQTGHDVAGLRSSTEVDELLHEGPVAAGLPRLD